MTDEYKQSVDAFLKIKNIAIAGYSTNASQPANHIYKRFSENGYNVYPVNPKSSSITDVKCYTSLEEIHEPLDGVVVCTPAVVTPSVISDCIRLNIKNIWIHRAFDQGSYNQEAVELCKKHNINCISVGCPLMFLNADFPHKCIRWFMDFGGKLKN